MSDKITVEALDIETLDADGAIRESEAAIDGDTRGEMLRKGAVGGAALLGGGVLLSGFPGVASAQRRSKKLDTAILNYALTLEFLEAEFYKEAIAKGALSGNVLSTTRIVSSHENTHVKTLKSVLGRKAVKKPRFDFKNTTGDQATFLKTAVVLEDTGVAAYAGQGPRILQKPVVVAALSIHSVEARHAAQFRSLNNQNFAPKAFDKAKTMRQVLKAVGNTGFIKS